MEMEVIRGKSYVYCEEHDIWYPKKLYDETQRRKKKGFIPDTSLDILSCPLCIRDLMSILDSVGIPEERSSTFRFLSQMGQHRGKSKKGKSKKD